MKIKKTEEYLKIAVLGESGVGKTSLCARLTKDYYHTGYELTVGVHIHSHIVEFEGRPQHILLYDVAGQPRFDVMLDVFIRGAVGVLLVYDCSSVLTFFSLEEIWLPFITRYLPGVSIVLVSNKSDQTEFREVSESQVELFLLEHAEEFNFVSFVRTSARTGVCIEEMIREIVAACNLPPAFRMAPRNALLVGAEGLVQPTMNVGTHALSCMPSSYNRQQLTNSKTEEKQEG